MKNSRLYIDVYKYIYLCNALAKVLANFLGREFCDSGAQDGIYRSS